MDMTFLNAMKELLLSSKEELIRNLAAESEEFKEIIENMEPKDMVDIATEDIDRKTLETLSSNDVRRIRLIDSALSRMQNGRFGLCIKCGKKIPKERLRAIPYALMCISCKTSDERRNR